MPGALKYLIKYSIEQYGGDIAQKSSVVITTGNTINGSSIGIIINGAFGTMQFGTLGSQGGQQRK